MKRILSFLLCISLLAGLSACGPTSQPTEPSSEAIATQAATTETTVPIEITVPVVNQPESIISISMPVVEETVTVEDGTLLFTHTFQNVSLDLEDEEIAEQVQETLQDRIDSLSSLAESVKISAQADYPGSSYWSAYSCSVIYNPMRIDAKILSLFGSQASYKGGAHPSHIAVSATFDLSTGKVLSLKNVLSEEVTGEAFAELAIEALSALDISLYSDYASTVQSRFSSGFDETEGWYLSANGLCLFFSPYDIAPYSAGIVTAEIPYEMLEGVLKEEYLPSDKSDGTGTCLTASAAETDLETFSQLTKVALSEAGKIVVLYTDGTVYDVRLESGTYSGGWFTPTATVFACDTLRETDAVSIQTDAPLRLTYRSCGEEVSLILE